MSLALRFALGLLLSPAPTSEAPSPEPATAETVAAESSEASEASEASAAEAAPPAPSYDFETYEGDPIGVKRFVLPNGLTVLLSENHERPEVFGAVVVKTGGKNDPADNTGMAHYLEHMLFKGTTSFGTTDWASEKPLQDELVRLYEAHKAAKSEAERKKLQAQIGETVAKTYPYTIPNETSRILSEMGGTGVNAFTSEDETVYHNTFPASQMQKWLEVYAHRFQDPVFRLFPTELEAVYEEKNISLDRFEVKLFETMTREAFPEHPYGTQTVIGEVEHLKRPSLAAMREYFDTYYVANNMALVLSGDFDAEEVMPLIEAQFGQWRSGPDPQPREGKVEPFEGRERVSLRVTPLRVGAFAFRTPTQRHPDYAALTVIRELLSNNQGSGYLDRLVEEGKLLIAFPLALDTADHGLDILFFAPRLLSQSYRNAEKHVLRQYRRIAEGDFDQAEMVAIRDNLRRLEDRNWEDNRARALLMGSSFIRHDSWQGYLDYRERLAALDREEVMRVAAKYFGDDHLSMRSRMGFPRKKHLQAPHYPSVKPNPGARSEAYERFSKIPDGDAKLELIDPNSAVQRVAVREGVRLSTVPNPFNDTYSLELRFGVGTDAMRELWVAPDFVSRLGTAKHSAEGFKKQLFLLGTTYSSWATEDELVVRLEGPEDKLGAALALLNERLSSPKADKKTWKRFKRERRGMDKVMRRDPDERARAALDYVTLGKNSDYLRDYGKKGVRKLSPKGLIAKWKEAQGYGVEVEYAGKQSPQAVAETLREHLSFAPTLRPRTPKVVYPRVEARTNRVFFLPKKNELQSRIYFHVEGDAVPREQQYLADAYRYYLGGSMAGLIFQEIREFRALAYSAWGGFYQDPTPAQEGYFLGYVGCQADKTHDAVAAMLELIQDMPVDTDQLDSLRGALIRGQEIRTPSFRKVFETLRGWGWRGYTDDPRSWLIPAYERLRFSDIESFYAEQIKGRPVTVVVVGDPRRFDADGLAKYGKVTRLKEKQIYAP